MQRRMLQLKQKCLHDDQNATSYPFAETGSIQPGGESKSHDLPSDGLYSRSLTGLYPYRQAPVQAERPTACTEWIVVRIS